MTASVFRALALAGAAVVLVGCTDPKPRVELTAKVLKGPSASEPSPSGTLGHRAGGYAGLDAAGALCWALPTTFKYESYEEVRRMQTVATLGASAVIAAES